MTIERNPFPLEAVATYGANLRTTASLRYMLAAQEELDNYLLTYADRARRSGGAVGLTGGHGSGKTHLLNWLGERATSLKTLPVTGLYAKVDSASIFDLHAQFLAGLERERIVDVIHAAIRALGLEQVREARATESVARRLDDPNELTKLAEEGNLDLDNLFSTLRARLDSKLIPTDIPHTLLRVVSASVGQQAYDWFSGKQVRRLADLGLTHHLGQLQAPGRTSATPDVIAISALETLAALHDIAAIPLVILVDQLEVLSRVEVDRRESAFSLVKKLIEQTAAHHALLFLAGTEAAWRALPRDFSPRMRFREPLTVGALARDEIAGLVNAYVPSEPQMAGLALATLESLSGGNPREVLRIAYHAFEATDGVLSAADPALLIRCAEESGTVDDRHRLALGQADLVLEQHGAVARDVDTGQGVLIDRVVRLDGVPVLAVAGVKATDQRSEIDSAHRIRVMRQFLSGNWPRAGLVVVAIGYSSDEVRVLLADAGVTTIRFDEPTFSAQLNAEALKLIARARTAAPSQADTALFKTLERVATTLENLDRQRAQSEATARERFATTTAKLVEPEQRARIVRSRYEMLEELDRLRFAQERGDVPTEREIIRAMLVSNETHLKDSLFDRLGGIYLDIASMRSSASGPGEEQSASARRNLAVEMGRVLRQDSVIDRVLKAPFSLWLKAGLVAVAAWVLGWIVLLGSSGLLERVFSVERVLVVVAKGTAFSGVVVGLAYLSVAFERYQRFRRWKRRANELRYL